MGKAADEAAKQSIGHGKRSARAAPSPNAAGKLSPAGAKIVGAFEEAITLMQTS